MRYPLIGKKEVIIGDELIPSSMVADEVGSVTIKGSKTEIASQEGTISLPNGSFDELSAKINLIVPSVRYLGMIFPDLWKIANFRLDGYDEDDIAGEAGQVIFGAQECKTTEPKIVIIRNACDTESSQDVRIPQALIANGGEFTFNLKDPVKIELDITPLPGTGGSIIFGVGDLAAPSKYDVEEGKYMPVSQS